MITVLGFDIEGSSRASWKVLNRTAKTPGEWGFSRMYKQPACCKQCLKNHVLAATLMPHWIVILLFDTCNVLLKGSQLALFAGTHRWVFISNIHPENCTLMWNTLSSYYTCWLKWEIWVIQVTKAILVPECMGGSSRKWGLRSRIGTRSRPDW